MMTESAKVASPSTRHFKNPRLYNISTEYPVLPDHDLMNNSSLFTVLAGNMKYNLPDNVVRNDLI